METKEIAFKNLLAFKLICDKISLPILLDGGTCLGAYRDKDFCQDDENDVDLTSLDQYTSLIPELSAKCTEQGLLVYHYWNLGEKSTQQISFKRDNMKIDLMFKKIKNEWAWWTIFRGNNISTYKKVPAHFYLETQLINFKGTEFLIPKSIKEYLTYRYGNWNNKVHRSQYSCYTTDKCIVKNYEEI